MEFSVVLSDGDEATLLPPVLRLSSPFIDEQQAAALFNVDVATWREWDQTGRIPAAVVVAGLPRWDEAELQAWYESGAPPRNEWEAKKAASRNSEAQASSRLMNVKATAAYLGLAVQTVRNRSHEIPGRRNIGRKVVYDRAIIDRWVDRNDGTRDLKLDARRMRG